MIDGNNTSVQGQDPAATANTSVQNPVVSAPDNMVPKERVTELIRENRREVSEREYARGKAEAEARYQSQQTQQQPQSMGGMAAPDEAKIRQMMSEEFTRQSDAYVERSRQEQKQQHATNLANEVMSKITAAKDRFPDLEKRVDEIAAFSELIPLINSTEDAAGVIHDLLENPLKMGQLLTVAQRAPQLALTQMQKLASSIKANEAGKNAPHINEPLSHTSPSIMGMSSGSDSIEDLKSRDYLRG